MQLAGLTINVPVMNAACNIARTQEDVDAMCKTRAGAVLIGSITPLARDGNPEPRWYAGEGFALNSFGMPNGGIEFYEKELPEMAKKIHDSGKIVFLNIAGFNKQDYVDLAKMANSTGVDILEMNFGCPNVLVNGEHKPIVSFDPEAMKEVISAVKEVCNLPLAIKLSPYSNPGDLKAAADVLIEAKVTAVVTSNTFPNGFYSSATGEPVLATELAGVSGQAMKAIALGQVRQFRNLLPPETKVIGVGGIETKEDVELYRKAGADMVQVATLIVRDGHDAINKVIK